MSECKARAKTAQPNPRILLAIESLDGGSGRHAVDLAEELARRGRDVTIAYSPRRANALLVNRLETNPGIATARFDMRRAVNPSDLLALWRLWRICRKHGPFDIVHGHSSKAGAAVRLLPVRARKVYTPHAFRTMDPTAGTLKRVFYGGMERFLALFTDAMIAGSLFEFEHAEKMKIRPKRTMLIANGVIPSSDNKRAELRAELRARAGIADDEVCIGSVGRFARQKNPDRLVAALGKALAAEPNAKGVIVGGGALSKRVRAKVAALGLGNRIHIVENEPGEPWMAAFDLFVVSSDYEAMPYVFIEALFAGLPIVSTWVGGSDESVDNGENGYTTPVGDDAAFVARIIELVRDDAKRARFAARSAEKSADFHLSVMTDKVEEAYAQVITRAPAVSVQSASGQETGAPGA